MSLSVAFLAWVLVNAGPVAPGDGPLCWTAGSLICRGRLDPQLQDPRSEGEAQEKPTKEPLPPFPVFRDFNSLNPAALLLCFLKRLFLLTHCLSLAFPVPSVKVSGSVWNSFRSKNYSDTRYHFDILFACGWRTLHS